MGRKLKVNVINVKSRYGCRASSNFGANLERCCGEGSSAPRGFIIDADKSNYSHPRESGRKERGKITSGLIKFL